MFKTLSVSIGKMPFLIEEKAYHTLERYLDAIRAHFAKTADAEEIVSDIESRMAEEFSEALGKQRKIIEQEDVDAVIASMGTVEDFRKFDEGESHSHKGYEHFSFQKIRLYRDADNQILGGVCSGIANYFGIDPIITRLAFGLSVFLGGFGVLLYIVLWVILPEARTTAQKVEMTGGRVTLSAIQKRIDEVVPPGKRKNILSKIVAFPFLVIGTVLKFVGRVLRFVGPILGFIIGLALAIGAVVAISMLTFTLFTLLFNPTSPYIGLPIYDAISKTAYATIILCGYFIAFLPLIFILLAGTSLLTRRNALTLWTIIGLVGVWFVAATIGSSTVFSVAPQLEPVFESYDATTEKTFPLRNFRGIAADNVERIEIFQGAAFSVTLVGTEEGLLANEPIVENGILSIRTTEQKTDRCMIFCKPRHVRLQVTMPTLTSVDAKDASHVSFMGFSGEAMTFTLQDIGRIVSDANFTTVTATLKDASRLELHGSAQSIDATISDVSRMNGEGFDVQNATLTLHDASRATLDVRESLKGLVTDVSRIEYLTAPASIEVERRDMGRVEGQDIEESRYE